jgi:hypothetical protein
MGSKGSLPYPQELTTYLYAEVDEKNIDTGMLFLEDPF